MTTSPMTSRCQPWCDSHRVDTSEVDHYGGVPHYWHHTAPVEVVTEAGQTLAVSLELFEPANDPIAVAATIEIRDARGWAAALFGEDDCPIPDARRLAEAILSLCKRAAATR